MELERFNENVSIHQTLGDNPNTDNDLSAQELKAKFDRAAELIKQYLNDHVVPAVNGKIDTILVPVAIDPTLSKEGYAADAKGVGTALAGKAPAGYGLGSWAKLATDLNDAKECGWYFFGSSATNAPPYVQGVLLVLNRNHTYEVMQIAWDSSTGTMAQRAYRANSWGGWEFINPPMVLGVEYRTTERWNGKAVYTNVVDCGAMPNNTFKNTTTNIGDCFRIIATAVSDNNGNRVVYTLPILSNNGIRARVAVSGGTIQVYTTEDLSAYTCHAQIWYTKD